MKKNTLPVTSIDDPRVAAYRNLRERTLRGENLFLAEGQLLVERLLRSDYQVESIFADEDALGELQESIDSDIPVHVASKDLMREVVGFDFHRGVLAAGQRGLPKRLEELLGAKESADSVRLVILPQVEQSENFGLIFRSAAAFGVDGVVLGPGSGDPLSRRALRLSMGGVLRVPFVRCTDLADDLRRLKQQWNVELVATVLDEKAETLSDLKWPSRTGLLLGNEYKGIDQSTLALCDRQVTIPMRPDTDSLNLGVAAGIFVYEMSRAYKPAGQGE